MRTAVFCLRLRASGGAEAVSAWAADTLAEFGPVDVFTYDAEDLARLDEVYGTNLKTRSVKVVRVALPRGLRWLGGLGKQHYLMRVAKSRGPDYDLVASTWDEMDLGRRGIQYVHFPSLNEKLSRQLGRVPSIGAARWYHRDTALRRAYAAFCRSISDYSEGRMLGNYTMASSRWVADLFQRAYGTRPEVVYPPVVVRGQGVPWEERTDDFIMIGRISAEKRVHEAIQVIEQVRVFHPNVKLHLAGPWSDDEYGRFVRALVRERSWVVVHGLLGRQEISTLLGRHKFGIHCMAYEPSSIGVSELVQAGCIAFVPDSGGSPELVGYSPYLRFQSITDAVEKIVRVLRDPDLQRSIADHLEKVARSRDLEQFRKAWYTAIETVVAPVSRRAGPRRTK